MREEANGMETVATLLRDHDVIRDDEVWVHGMWTPGKWWACIKARLRGRKLVRMTHGSLSPVYLKYGKLKKWLVGTFIERPLFSLSDRVAVTGPWEETWCRNWGLKGPFQTIDVKSFFKFPSPSERQPKSMVKNRPLRVLFLGRRHPLKGIEFLERAVDDLNREKGSDSLVQLQIVSDHIGEELENDWSWVDVLVLPTLSENFGLVVAEALERGKRVITTDGAPAWEDQPGVVYLKGYRDGADERRVELLRQAIGKECRNA